MPRSRSHLCLAALLAGCVPDNPSSLRDTTGAEIGWSCGWDGCTTVQHGGAPVVPSGCGDDTEHLVGAGALAILCAVSRGAGGRDVVHERTCRPIACADELDCPQWEDRRYLCVASICQNEDLALDRLDVTALCLYDVPRHESCGAIDADPEVARRMALVEEACDGARCHRVPAECLSP
ncbi:MAG TPA: hypothetical protein VIL20_31440 [Sandaracinaceae bacterium]